MKRTLTAGIGAVLALAMTACGGEGADSVVPFQAPQAVGDLFERVAEQDREARAGADVLGGRETVWAFGHGFQVWARPDRIEVTQEELVQLATSLVEEMA